MFKSEDELEQYLDGLSREELLGKLSECGEDSESLDGKATESLRMMLKGILLGDVKEEKKRVRSFAPRRLRKDDLHSPRGYKRLLNLFDSLEILNDFNAQEQFLKNTQSYFLEQKRKTKKNFQKVTDEQILDYLKEHPEIFEKIKSQF